MFAATRWSSRKHEFDRFTRSVWRVFLRNPMGPRDREYRQGNRALRSTGETAVSVERSDAASSVIDVLDRVLDKGIVIDTWLRVSVIGIDLITIEAHVTVASIETWFRHAPAPQQTTPATTTIKTVTSQRVQVQLADRIPIRPGRRRSYDPSE